MDRKDGLKVSVVEGVFAQVHINLTAGMFLTSFALFIGLNDIGIGLLSAIPAFFTGFAFFSLFLIKVAASRRTLCVLCSLLGRGVFAILAILLLAQVMVGYVLFFAIIIVHNILMNLSGNAWLSWMSDLVPREKRGRYFAVRNTILSLVGMVTNVAGGKILDFYKTAGELAKGLGLLYTGAAVSSTIAAGVLVTRELLRDRGRPGSIVLHSLPRMDELPEDVDGTRHARYWSEAFNGVVMRMALISLVLGAME